MIVRARPKYIFESDIIPVLEKSRLATNCQYNDGKLYYTSGHIALRHILATYSSFVKRRLHVAMQSFNCITVLNAALAAGADVTLMDNTLQDFSISMTSITKIEPKPDVLILTHYQGIPNNNYIEIAEFCHSNGIFLIDDICQTEGSVINHVKVGTLSDAAFGSFGFDKPISVFNGGYIQLNNVCNQAFCEQLTRLHSDLDIEPQMGALRDLELLYIGLKITSEETYTETFDRSDISLYPFLKTMWPYYQQLSKNGMFSILMRVYRKARNCLYKWQNDPILRLSPLKQVLLPIQHKRLHQRMENGIPLEEQSLKKLLDKYGICYPMHEGTCWNRFSFLDQDGIFAQHIQRKEIQYGNYNWSTPMHLNHHVRKNKHVKFSSSMANAELCAAKIVNVPVWSKYFTELLNV